MKASPSIRGSVPNLTDSCRRGGQISSAALVGAAKPAYDKRAFHQVLRITSGRSLSPQLERTRLEVRSHGFDDFNGSKIKLDANGVERCSIFPRHLDDVVDLFWLKIWILG